MGTGGGGQYLGRNFLHVYDVTYVLPSPSDMGPLKPAPPDLRPPSVQRTARPLPVPPPRDPHCPCRADARASRPVGRRPLGDIFSTASRSRRSWVCMGKDTRKRGFLGAAGSRGPRGWEAPGSAAAGPQGEGGRGGDEAEEGGRVSSSACCSVRALLGLPEAGSRGEATCFSESQIQGGCPLQRRRRHGQDAVQSGRPRTILTHTVTHGVGFPSAPPSCKAQASDGFLKRPSVNHPKVVRDPAKRLW